MGLVQLDEWYSPQEICELLHVKDGSHYARDVKRKLDKMGLKYEYKRKYVKFLEEPKDIEKRLQYLLELKGIKVVEVRDFAVFYYCLINFEEYQYCPWKYRAELLRQNYECNVDFDKLRKWGKMLVDAGMLTKTLPEDKQVWRSSWYAGETFQEPVDMNNEKAVQEKNKYWYTFWNKVQYYKKHPEEITNPNRNPTQQAGIDCRREFGCCYYNCQNFITCAWSSNEEEQTIRDIINTYMETIYPTF